MNQSNPEFYKVRPIDYINIGVPYLVKSQEELTKLIQEFIEETDVQFDYPKLPKYWLEDYHWDLLCEEINNEG